MFRGRWRKARWEGYYEEFIRLDARKARMRRAAKTARAEVFEEIELRGVAAVESVEWSAERANAVKPHRDFWSRRRKGRLADVRGNAQGSAPGRSAAGDWVWWGWAVYAERII